MYRVGLIGCGDIAAAHVDGFARTGRARVTAVYDIDPDTARQRAAEWQATPVAEPRDIIGADVDIVTVATPGFARVEYVIPAARVGKHIMCEKPLALDLDTARRIRAALADTGVTFQVHFLKRFQAPTCALKTVLDEGRIGEPVSAWARWHAPAPTARWLAIEQSGHWRSSRELSGGRINEFCSHAVNWLLWILGSPRTVYGRALHVTRGFSLDDADMAIIECERGVGLLDVNRHAGVAEEDNYGIVGHDGSVVFKNGRLYLTPMDGDTAELPLPDAEMVTPHEHFLNCIERGVEPRNSIADAIDTLTACLAFNRSAARGTVEAV